MPKILIVGDGMTDSDIQMELVKTMDGMPVYREIEAVIREGGAANVRDMCQALGAEVELLTLGRSLKRRLYIDGKILCRVDSDINRTPDEHTLKRWRQYLPSTNPDIILVCDHAKGVVTKEVMELLKSFEIPIYVDPCVKSDWSLFDGVECISANREEWNGHAITSRIAIQRRDKEGVKWLDEDLESRHIDSTCKNVVDTVGAGDQFVAMLAVMRARGNSWEESIEWANIAAGLQCERRGIVPVTFMEMSCAIDESLSKVQSKP